MLSTRLTLPSVKFHSCALAAPPTTLVVVQLPGCDTQLVQAGKRLNMRAPEQVSSDLVGYVEGWAVPLSRVGGAVDNR
jgi:hypothetical protein